MSQLRKFLIYRMAIVGIFLLIGGTAIYYVNAYLKQEAYEKWISKRDETHNIVLSQFE